MHSWCGCHDFTTVTRSVKLAVFCTETGVLPWNLWFSVSFRAFRPQIRLWRFSDFSNTVPFHILCRLQRQRLSTSNLTIQKIIPVKWTSFRCRTQTRATPQRWTLSVINWRPTTVRWSTCSCEIFQSPVWDKVPGSILSFKGTRIVFQHVG